MRTITVALLLGAFPLAALAQTGTAYIPKAIELPGLTPTEASANQLWSLRGALNVAALQCQFTPFLRIVGRYNGMIHQHSRELDRARVLLGRYFLRTAGTSRAGQDAFDRYNTRMFQSYSTLDAQLGFCNQAAIAGRNALVQPVGHLGEIAQIEVTALRTSLTPLGAVEVPVTEAQLPPIEVGLACTDRRGRC